MAYTGGSPPDDYPVIRPPPMRPPPGRPPPPPRQVHFEDTPSYAQSPSRGRGGVSPPSPRRFARDSPPERYLEGRPRGYQESPPRVIPGRRSNPPPAQYLSPEDSPPYRYTEDASRRYPLGTRPYSEDAPLPPDIDGPPPPGFREEAPRRFGANRATGPARYHSESESPSPPPGHMPRPPPPPPGEFLDEPRRFGGSPRQFRRYADDDSPPTRYADEARRFGGAPRRPDDRSPPSPGYDQPRRFAGTPPQFYDNSPPSYADEAPRRFGGSPRRFAEGSPPSPPEGGPRDGNAGDRARRGPSNAPPRRPRGPLPPGYEDTSPPRFEGGALPPRVSPAGSSPTRTDDPPGRFAGTPPLRQFADGSSQGPPGPSVHPGRGAQPREYTGGPPPGYKESSPGRFVAEPREFAAAAAAGAAATGVAGYAEDVGRRQPPGGGHPPEPSGPGFGPPGPGPQPREFPGGPPPGPAGLGAQHREFTGGPPGDPGRPDPSAYIGLGTPPRQPPEGFSSPPGPDPRRPPGTPPRFPPEALAGGLGRRPPTPGSEDSSPPGVVRYAGDDLLALRAPGSASPAYADLGGRFQRSPDGYGALPPHATPPREGYRPPPPGLGQGGDAPLLSVPPGYATPQRAPPGAGGARGDSPPIPAFLFARPQRRYPDGYKARTPPRERDAIFTAPVVVIELDEKLKDVQPHRGNPGSSTGGAWKDTWAALLFLLHVGGIAALSIIFGLQGLTHTIQHYREQNTFHINNWLPQLGAAAVTGGLFSIIWLNAIRLAPVFMILTTVWTGATVMIMVGIVLVATGQTLGLVGIAFFFAGISQALYGFIVRGRIPFAGEMLKKAISVCNAYPSTYAVSFGVLLLSLVWTALWIFGLSGSGIRPLHALIMAGFIASQIWTMQVLRNIVRVTVAGTVSYFYFQEKNMPSGTTAVALLRACTTSLGSICFGSLFVPLIEAPYHALRRINSQAGASEFLFSCVLCFLACYEHLIRYFNKMGYIQVAIYGKPFLRASKDTFDMLRAQEVDLLVHDDLTSTIIFMACGIGGSLSALVGGIYTFVAHKSLTIIITIISYVIGALLTYITMAVLESGVATYYVCFAEDPDSLQRYDGPFYERMWVRQMELQAPTSELSD